MWNEFPQEGLALKPSDFLKFREIKRIFQAAVVLGITLVPRFWVGSVSGWPPNH